MDEAVIQPNGTKLRPLTKQGQFYAHIYTIDGVEFVQECTKQEYEALALPGAKAPNVPGKWECSGHFDKFDTPTGLIEEGTYYDDGNRQYVKTNGLQGVLLSGTIQNDTLLTADTAQLESYGNSI